MHKRVGILLLTIGMSLGLAAQEKNPRFQGQTPIRAVSTESKPIDEQTKRVIDLGGGVYLSNNFKGGRLNDAWLENDTLVSLLINPESWPINQSPWYAFRIWGDSTKAVTLTLNFISRT